MRAGLVAFSNIAHTGLDPDADPDGNRLAEVILDQFHSHVGVDRLTKGDRAAGVASSLARYVLPWAIELAAGRPPARRGIAHLRLQQAEDLPRILSGDLALPAATVAGDPLRRAAITCLWLTLQDAARVTRGGAAALGLAIAQGALASSTDRDGQELVFAADLRAADLLIEPDLPHGLARSTATGIVKLLSKAVARAATLARSGPAIDARCRPRSVAGADGRGASLRCDSATGGLGRHEGQQQVRLEGVAGRARSKRKSNPSWSL